jgi:hypothetical protein
MPPKRLRVHGTPKEVALCPDHLRTIFNREDLWGKAQRDELGIRPGPIKLRSPDRIVNGPPVEEAPCQQEYILFKKDTLEEVARCHRFVNCDGTEIKDRELPDPKQINWEGEDYHQLGRGNPDCPHCKDNVPLNIKTAPVTPPQP